MSTQVATPATTIEPTGVTSAVTEPTAALVEAEAPPAAVAPAVESHDDAAAATSSPAHGKKRSPFGDLKNKLFHKSTSPTRAKSHEHAAATEETPKENAPIATEQAATTPSIPEAEAVPVAATTEGAATAAAPVAEAPVVHHDEEAHKKPKSPGVFEKVKSFFGENKKDKKAKTPTEEKAEPHLTTDAPVAAPAEGETAAAPAETAAVPVVTAPETVAAAEATANTTAPVPQVIEPIPEPINEPSTAAEISTSAAEPETAATAGAADAGPEVKPEGEGAVKVEEQAKTDDKAPKRDLAKLSRRLSAKVGALLHSPKKEKKEKDVALHVEGGETTSAEAAPKIETAVDESKLDTAAAKSEPVGASASATEPVPVVEAAPIQLGAAPATETKTETPAAVPVVAATA
ncbi:hypothetical protein JCM8115_004959 [Rhodotorula mucilaginosa]|nr:hypothetical protein B0A53_00606 [Rhodotorula sp. CCFEE 5036]